MHAWRSVSERVKLAGVEMLRIAQMLPSTEAEGPGRRFAIWVQGCSLRCKGCCNPEMFARDGGIDHTVTSLLEAIHQSGAEGISILGGEPFEQPGGCAALAEGVRAMGRTVMVYTGYRIGELRDRHDPSTDRLLSSTDVLVDGRFDPSLRDTTRRFVGSTNQRIHFLSDRMSPTDPSWSRENTFEIRFRNGELFVNGFPGNADAVLNGGPYRKKRLHVA